MSIRQNYNHTLYACYFGYITQAIVNNFAPLLFLTFQEDYDISLAKIAMITSINFAVQLLTDLVAVKFVDKVGYRFSTVLAHILCGSGLIGLAVFPGVVGDPFVAILMGVVLYAIGGGLIEVLISPIVEACPTDNKEAAMSLLHSFYCWGVVGVVLLSTLFFVTAGIENWKILACLWAILPLVNAVYFCLVPIRTLNEGEEGLKIGELFGKKEFWILMMLMVCAGASEQGMSQWASAFAEAGLHISKTIGDLAGPCVFSILMGSARVIYSKLSDKLPLEKAMGFCAVLCIGGYLLASQTNEPVFGLMGCAMVGFSVGIFWPGTFSLASKRIRLGGTAMFAFLALAGDLGCSSGPAVVGFVSDAFGANLKKGLFAVILFPLVMLFGLFFSREKRFEKNKQ